jgi:two-component system sensor histidine kinase/response regulator
MKRLLLIDDEEDFREATKALLELRGFTVETAADGLAGVKMARRAPPDLILCDLMMEPVDGFMTLSVLRQHIETAGIPFVIVSGRRELESMRQGLLLGADDYLTKPFTPLDLVSSIDPILERHRATMESAEILIRELAAAVDTVPERQDLENVGALRFLADELVTLSRPRAQITAKGHRLQIERALNRLKNHLGDSRLLDLIDRVAVDHHAMAALRKAGSVDVAGVIDAEIDRIAAGFGRRIVRHIEPGRIGMRAPILLRVFGELLTNALLHARPKTVVHVDCRSLENGYLIKVENQICEEIDRASATQLNQSGWESRLPSMFRSGSGLRVVNGLTSLHGGMMTLRLAKPDRTVVQLHFPS